MDWLVENTIVAFALAVIVLAICTVLKPRPAIAHGLWLVVLVKLVLPPLLEWPMNPVQVGWLGGQDETPIDREPQAAIAQIGARETNVSSTLNTNDAPSPYESPSDVRSSAGTTAEMAITPPPLAHSTSDAQQSIVPPLVIRWPTRQLLTAASYVWLAGGIVLLTIYAFRILRMQRRLTSARPAAGPLAEEVVRLSELFRVRPPEVWVVPGMASPCLWCLGRPRLLWPESLAGRFQPSGWRGVVAHELAHLRRRDHWVLWVELLASVVWWLNPLLWFVRRRLAESAEAACDAWVVALLPGEREPYAAALVEVIQSGPRASAPVLALGAVRAARRNMERRLAMILRAQVPSRVPWVYGLAIGLLMLVALPAWSRGEPQADEPSATEQPIKASSAERELKAPAAQPEVPALAAQREGKAPAAQREGKAPAAKREGKAPAAQREGKAPAEPQPGSAPDGSAPPPGRDGFGDSLGPAAGYVAPDRSRGLEGSYGGMRGGMMGGRMGPNEPMRIRIYRPKHVSFRELASLFGLLFADAHVYAMGGEGMMPGASAGGGMRGGMPGMMAGGRMGMGMPGMMERGGYGSMENEPFIDVQGVSLALDARTGALLARGTAKKLDQLFAQLKRLDVPRDQLPVSIGPLRLYQLRHASAAHVTSILGGLGIHAQTIQIQGSDVLLVAVDEQEGAELDAVIKALDVVVDDVEAGRPGDYPPWRSQSRGRSR